MLMDNQQPSYDTQNQNLEQQTYQTSQITQPVVSASQQQGNKGKKKGRAILIAIALLILILGGAAAYIFLVFIPNKPENIFKKAVLTYATSRGNYTVTGRLDQGGPNDADYDYIIQTNTKGDSSAEVQMSTFMQRPKLAGQKVNGKYYVKFSQFYDTAELAKHFRNSGSKGSQEYIAEFADKSNLTPNLDKWLEVDSYILDNTASTSADTSTPKDITGITLDSASVKETLNNVSTRKYVVTLPADSFIQFAALINKSANMPLLTTLFPSGGLSADSFKMNVWVNLKTKTIEQVTYSGRPFKDATLSLKVVANNKISITAPQAEKLTSKLSYGIVTSGLFNKDFQIGEGDGDRERIADLKGIKTALEIYKAKTGHYPERYDLGANQESFIGSQMPGADFEVFKDPAGRFIGLNGSQYAYTPALNDDTQDCGKFSKPCEKYFIATTLDSGKQYQLNSN